MEHAVEPGENLLGHLRHGVASEGLLESTLREPAHVVSIRDMAD